GVKMLIGAKEVFGPDDSQKSVFQEVCPLLISLLDGYNVCIMAYGQTGSGKTHTMLGPHSEDNFTVFTEPQLDEGIIPQAVRELYRLISMKPPETHSVEVSIVEVYNNEIIDLLAKDESGAVLGVKREVMTMTTGGSDVPFLSYEYAKNPTDILNFVTHGLRHRAKHGTLVHAHSSRSHLVVTLTVTTKITTANRSGKEAAHLNFPYFAFFLSGMSGVTGAALRETSFINRSLSALSDVLGALAEQRSHVPYRNSKLTHLLQDSIGGDAKLMVMLCVSPAQRYITESLQSLGFGARARQVQRGHIRKKSTEKKSSPSIILLL
uniref:Kinesin family member 25 n=1 Tax=Callorhinchus milii TaxID=7868 RepID=A0A4W3IG60_CALMI